MEWRVVVCGVVYGVWRVVWWVMGGHGVRGGVSDVVGGGWRGGRCCGRRVLCLRFVSRFALCCARCVVGGVACGVLCAACGAWAGGAARSYTRGGVRCAVQRRARRAPCAVFGGATETQSLEVGKHSVLEAANENLVFVRGACVRCVLRAHARAGVLLRVRRCCASVRAWFKCVREREGVAWCVRARVRSHVRICGCGCRCGRGRGCADVCSAALFSLPPSHTPTHHPPTHHPLTGKRPRRRGSHPA